MSGRPIDRFRCLACGHKWEQAPRPTPIGPDRSAGAWWPERRSACPVCPSMYARWLNPPGDAGEARHPPLTHTTRGTR